MQIQEYNFHIQHTRGAESFLAETVSRNLAGLCERDTKELFKPKDMVVATINLSNDNSVGGSLKELLTCQACEKGVQEIIRIVRRKQQNANKTVMV